ncbi:MAG: type VI secretion system baseplate subunit TssE [Paracoccaceae bacterium]|nr:type VI secretion system baseplate subunit TssE [Paracoccaceae bacterium]
MIESVTSPQSRREAVQPSLWDRLLDDLPGLVAETDRRKGELERDIGAERVARLLAGGRRVLEQEASLDQDERREVHLFLSQIERRAYLEERGIVVTPDVLREAVRRDIEALFNTERLEARLLLSESERLTTQDPEDVIADFPHVRRSVLNYGVPSFSGRRARDFDPDVLARELKEIVATFEPRLKSDSIRVKVDTGDKTGLKINIEAILLLSPVPERLRLSTSIDLDNGRAATAIEEL